MNPYLWFQGQDEEVAGTPATFGPRNVEAQVIGSKPKTVITATETVQSFPSSSDASKFLGGFAPHAPLPQVFADRALHQVQSSSTPLSGLGNQALVTVRSVAVAGVPNDIQYAVRDGATVLTLQLVGGQQLSVANTEAFAQSALSKLTSVCGSSA